MCFVCVCVVCEIGSVNSFVIFLSLALEIDVSLLKIQITFELDELYCHHDSGNKTQLCKIVKGGPIAETQL